jgi:hypothetical protein
MSSNPSTRPSEHPDDAVPDFEGLDERIVERVSIIGEEPLGPLQNH